MEDTSGRKTPDCPFKLFLTYGALPGGPHVLHADVQVGPVEAALFGFGVVILQILPEKLIARFTHQHIISHTPQKRLFRVWRAGR